MTLVGNLHIGTSFKIDPSKLTIGKSTVYLSHVKPFSDDHDLDLVRENYSGRTVLVRADILNHSGEFGQFAGYKIANVQHIEILEKP